MDHHQHDVELPPEEAADALARAAEDWGAEWTPARGGGRLVLPVVFGLRRGVAVGRVDIARLGKGSRLVWQLEESRLEVHRAAVAVFAILVTLCSIPLYRAVKQEYVPSNVDEGEFDVSVTAPEGMNVESMNQAMLAVEEELRQIRGIDMIYASAGGGFLGGVNQGSAFVRLVPHEERTLSFTKFWNCLVDGRPLPEHFERDRGGLTLGLRAEDGRLHVAQRRRGFGAAFANLPSAKRNPAMTVSRLTPSFSNRPIRAADCSKSNPK